MKVHQNYCTTQEQGLLKKIVLLLIVLLPVRVLLAQPSITSFAPTSGPVGTTVVISGNNFSSTPSANIVYFGTVKATVTTATSASLSVTVPAGASWQPISVTVTNLTAYTTRPFMVTFPGGGTLYPNSFTGIAYHNTTSYANCVAACDLDEDGKPDLIAANGDNSNGNAAANTVSFFRNTSSTGTISFTTKEDSVVGIYRCTPVYLAIADIDGDGKPDPVIVNGSQDIAVLRNTSSSGAISFERYVSFSTGQNPKAATVFDVDGDGKPDIVVANNSDNTISVLRNTSVGGVISFAPRVNFPSATGPWHITSGDLDGDGKPDLAVANGFFNTISVLRNTSTPGIISFTSHTEFPTSTFAANVTIGDLDGDGKQEIVCANGGSSNSVSVFLNTSSSGNIALAPKTDFTTGTEPACVYITDMDGDGKPDLTAANTGTNSVSVLKNTCTTGIISFAAKIDYGLGIGTLPRYLFICDYDGDGKPDIAAAHSNKTFVSVFQSKVTEPTIASFNPQLATTGTTITITGTNFSSATAVSFGGTVAASFTVVSPTTITAVVGSGATGDVTVTTSYGVASLSGFNYTALPVITSFTPVAAGSSATVTITGNYFLGTTAVSFGGTPASSFTVVSSTSIMAVVGAGTSGNVTVTTGVGTASLAGFTYTVRPTITSFSPLSGPIGTNVTITGTNFSATPANNIVYFGAVRAAVTAASATSLSVTVPSGAIYKPITVATNYYTAYSDKPFQVTFADEGSLFNNNYFTARTDSVTDAFPAGETTADFDGDGKPDIAVAITDSNRVSVFRNTGVPGLISFATKINLPGGPNPYGVLAADLNSDGKQDLVVFSFNITVLLNTSTPGNISFSAPQVLTGGSAFYVAAGDLDGDGRPDLVASNSNGGAVVVLKNTSNNGVLSFLYVSDIITNNSVGAERVAIADLNGDGKPDLAISNSSTNTISVFRNTSTPGFISFASRIDYNTGNEPYGISIGDLDMDGRPDIAVVNHAGSSVSVLRNTGSGAVISFAAKVDFIAGDGPYSLTIDDMNGDTKPDMIVTNRNDSTVSVFKNTGSAGVIAFDPKGDYRTGNEPQDASISDFDGDGLPDISVTNNTSRSISFFRNQHNRPVITSITPVSGIVGTVVTISGYNFSTATAVKFGGTAAGSYTIISPNTITAVAGEGSNGDVSVTNPTGTGIFHSFAFTAPVITSFTPLAAAPGASITITGTNFSAVAANNIVYFGATRAVVTAASTTSLTVTVPVGAIYRPITVTTHNLTAYSNKSFVTTFNTGGTDFTAGSFATKVDSLTGGSSRSVIIKDFDGDGKPDIAAPDFDNNDVAILRNLSVPGVVSLAPRITFPTDHTPWFIESGDFDGDGKPDLVTANYDAGTIAVLRNTSSPGIISFADKLSFNSDDEARYISVDDIDGDGKPDIAVANGFNSFVVFRNTSTIGAISFAAREQIHSSNLPVAIALGDLDNDGKPELVTSNNTNLNVVIFKNASTPGHIVYTLGTTLTLTGTPWGIAIGDLNEDGKADLAIFNARLVQGPAISVFQNTSTTGNISFAGPNDYPTENSGYGVTITDLNGDGKPDLAAANRGGPSYVSVFKNTTTGGSVSFSSRINYSTDFGPYYVQGGDIDGDGKTDLVTGNDNGKSVSVLLNKLTLITAVPDITPEELQVSVSPNPFTSVINIKTGKRLNNVQLALMNLQGNILYNSSYKIVQAGSYMQIVKSSLASGMYLLKITTSDGQATVKLVKL